VFVMAVTTNRNRPDRAREAPRSARRREMIEALVLLAVLIVLAVVARLPAA
jgi:putative copper export protein